MVQETCISQMMAEKQNALRERKPRYQELFLQGFWKASQHGLPWNTVIEVKPKREQIWGLVLPLMKHRRNSSKREKRKERSPFFPAPCCFALLSSHSESFYPLIQPLFKNILNPEQFGAAFILLGTGENWEISLTGLFPGGLGSPWAGWEHPGCHRHTMAL